MSFQELEQLETKLLTDLDSLNSLNLDIPTILATDSNRKLFDKLCKSRVKPLDYLEQRKDIFKVRTRLFEMHTKLVAYQAKLFSKSDFEDNVQNGNVGLLVAINRFDWTRNFQFNTFARFWIRTYIQRGLQDQRNSIKIPHNLVFLAIKLSKHIKAHPSISYEELEILFPEARDISRLLLNRDHIDLENWEVPSDDSTVDFLELERLKKALDALPTKDKEIIQVRFELGYEKLTLQEKIQKLDIRRESLRLKEIQILRKLRHSF